MGQLIVNVLSVWDSEPNEVRYEQDGFRCLISRHPSLGSLNGYVQIPLSNSLWGKPYDEIDDIPVHGGITFSGKFNNTDDWWIGFDCAHVGDFCPYRDSLFHLHVLHLGEYRDIEYVRFEITNMIRAINGLPRLERPVKSITGVPDDTFSWKDEGF